MENEDIIMFGEIAFKIGVLIVLAILTHRSNWYVNLTAFEINKYTIIYGLGALLALAGLIVPTWLRLTGGEYE
jgi:hypothetical protein